HCTVRQSASRGAVKLLLRSTWRAAGQRIAQVEEDHAQVRVLGLSGSDEPWVARNVGILAHEVQSAVLRVFPNGLRESAGYFLNVTILTRRRSRKPVPDGRRAVHFESFILEDIDSTVVSVEQCLVMRELKSRNSRAVTDRRNTAVVADDHVRYLAEDVSAAATAPEIVRDDAETFVNLHVKVEEGTRSGLGELHSVSRIKVVELPLQAAGLNVN